MKNDVYPCKPKFYYIIVGFNGVKIIWAYFRDVLKILICANAQVDLTLQWAHIHLIQATFSDIASHLMNINRTFFFFVLFFQAFC